MEEVRTNNVTFYDPSGFPPGPTPLGVGPIGDLLPGWDLFLNGEQQSLIGYNLLQIGDSPATIFEAKFLGFYTSMSISRDYGFYMPNVGDFSFRQRGDIPLDAQFLEIRARPPHQVFPETIVYVEDEPLDIVWRGPASYWLDISDYAGSNAEIRIDVAVDAARVIDGVSIVVPEPGTLLLLPLGLFILTLIRRKR
jgi:hypothetical protein